MNDLDTAAAGGPDGRSFRIASEGFVVMEDVIKALEFRIAIEIGRPPLPSERMETADAADYDFAIHRGIARATENGLSSGLFSYIKEVLVPLRAYRPRESNAATEPQYLDRVCVASTEGSSWRSPGGDADAA